MRLVLGTELRYRVSNDIIVNSFLSFSTNFGKLFFFILLWEAWIVMGSDFKCFFSFMLGSFSSLGCQGNTMVHLSTWKWRRTFTDSKIKHPKRKDGWFLRYLVCSTYPPFNLCNYPKTVWWFTLLKLLPVAHESASNTVERGKVALNEVHWVDPCLQCIHPGFFAPD